MIPIKEHLSAFLASDPEEVGLFDYVNSAANALLAVAQLPSGLYDVSVDVNQHTRARSYSVDTGVGRMSVRPRRAHNNPLHNEGFISPIPPSYLRVDGVIGVDTFLFCMSDAMPYLRMERTTRVGSRQALPAPIFNLTTKDPIQEKAMGRIWQDQYQHAVRQSISKLT